MKPLSGSVGAILDGIDISRNLSLEEVVEIRRAWRENLVIFFRNQTLSDERLMIFGRRFGVLYIHPNLAKKGRIRKSSKWSRSRMRRASSALSGIRALVMSYARR